MRPMQHASQARLRFALLASALLASLAAGCHARSYQGAPLDAFVVTVQNQGPDIHQLEVDYPNASFGRDTLPSGATYKYQPKLIGSGPIKVAFNDQAGKSHTATGPNVAEKERKNLIITIGQDEGITFEADAERTQ